MRLAGAAPAFGPSSPGGAGSRPGWAGAGPAFLRRRLIRPPSARAAVARSLSAGCSPRRLQGAQQVGHARSAVLLLQQALGRSAAAQVAERALAVLGRELAEGGAAAGANAPF